jgi:hypothetical protein
VIVETNIAAYAPADASRLARTLRLLAMHDISRWALTGGTAIELHLQQLGAASCLRPLNDIDFIADDFSSLPESLGRHLLLRHVHPHDGPGKTMLQGLAAETSVRIDVFRAYGNEMNRVQSMRIFDVDVQLVSIEDLVARHARLCCALLRGERLMPKFARDFLRLAAVIKPERIEPVWREHRKLDDPTTFLNTLALVREAVATRTDLLVQPVYSTDVNEACNRCEGTAAFALADPSQVLALLGYC